MNIVLCYPAEEKHIASIADASPDSKIINAGQEKIADAIFSADIYCGHAKVPVPWDKVIQQGRLQWIQSSAAGMDHCLVKPVIDSDVLVTSASGVLADQVAEHTIALLTGLLRSLPVFFRAQQAKEFIRRPTSDLHRSTIGVVGFGGVGRRLAKVLSAFKTTILATDWCPYDRPDYVESLWPADQLTEMASRVDILILCAPLSDHTRGMINHELLEKMRPGSVLVNVARGPLVIENDLVESLRSGHLAGAALDVTEEEPLNQSSPLWEMPNVIITPHVGGQSVTRFDDCTNFFCENLRRFHRGESLENLVDKRLGFPLREPPHS